MESRLRSLIWLTLGVIAAIPAAGFAACSDGERHNWAVQIDDDFLALANHDRDYTAGLRFTRVEPGDCRPPLSRPLERADALTRFGRLGDGAAAHMQALEYGLRLFTPANLEAESAQPNDRPYANLAYVTSSRLAVDEDSDTAFQSSLTLGVLGLPVIGGLHRGLHVLIKSPLPNGYSHQISNGGEPTFRYAVSRTQLVASTTRGERDRSLRYGVGGSIGYVSEASASLAFRSGPARAPWWSSPPMVADYGGQPEMTAPLTPGAAPDRGVIFEAGVEARLRFYNVFLQGQFRSSDVSFGSGELNHLLVEAWVGIGFRLESGLELSYTLRRQSAEIARGTGARAFTWGDLTFARRF